MNGRMKGTRLEECRYQKDNTHLMLNHSVLCKFPPYIIDYTIHTKKL